ncbi:MAG: gephyrin-like molybdotransferase Glp [Burkholderiaceae bacterium]
MNTTRPQLKSLADACTELLNFAVPMSELQDIASFDADGRVLARDLISELHVPPQDNSSMDGYALRCQDWADPEAAFPVSQRIAAGTSGQPLQAHSVARIFTGAPIPLGADAVVMQEDCEVLNDGSNRIRIRQQPKPGQWIRRAGEDVSRAAVVLSEGMRLGPAALGMAASIGLSSVPVRRQPRVALFSTGDELVMPGEVAPDQMPAGAIYNSNRFFLRALLQRFGCVVTDLGIVPDRLDATVQALRQAADQHDLILTSGGVSVGEEDHIKPAVQSLGELNLWQIAIKPGKPFAYGRVHRAKSDEFAHFIGLPGNPVSSFITFLLLVRPFLLKLQGANQTDVAGVSLAAHFDWPRADKRREFLRVRRNAAGGLDLYPNQSSGVLTSAVWGDGVVDNPPGQTIARGEFVRFISFAELLA